LSGVTTGGDRANSLWLWRGGLKFDLTAQINIRSAFAAQSFWRNKRKAEGLSISRGKPTMDRIA